MWGHFHVRLLVMICNISYRRMKAQLNSIISATFLISLWTRILKINFCKYSICSVYIVKSLSFFRCEAIFIIFLWKLIVTSLPPAPLFFIGFYREPVLPTRFLLLYILLIVAVSFWYQDGFQRKDVMRVILRSL